MTEPRADGGPPPPTGSLPAEPPIPPRRPHELLAHGDRRVDDWFWLRDRDDPAVLDHLRRENAWTEARLAHLEPLRQALSEEMVGRIQETDVSAPVRRGGWWYYDRTRAGADYPVHCRLPAVRPGDRQEEPPELTGAPEAEQVVMDVNRLAAGHSYLQLGTLTVSPGHDLLAYSTDVSGDERFTLRFRRLAEEEAEELPEAIPGISYGGAWSADGATFFYTRLDEAMRPHQVWRHRLRSDPLGDVLVLQEDDRRFHLSVHRTRDEQWVVISAHSSVTSELWVVPADRPDAEPWSVTGRVHEVEYALDHHPGPEGDPGWFLAVTNDGAEDFRVVGRPDDRSARGWVEVVPHRPGIRVEDLDVLRGWLVVGERAGGEPRVRLVPLPDPLSRLAGPAPLDLLGGSRVAPADEHPAATWVGANPEFDTPWLRLEQTSLVSPRATVDLDPPSGRRIVRRRQPVLGDFDPGRYRTRRLWARADDGTEVPISLVHRRELSRPGGDAGDRAGLTEPAPCLLYGYGAYEHSIDPAFSSLRLSLLDRGFVYAIAHVRGGGELGRRWYLDGKLDAKPHSFTDFVSCARTLVELGYTAPDRLAARGASAGGLLVGAVVNLAPELFRAVVAEVPFVDALTTILDDSLPLSVIEWEEWGNPASDPSAYRTMRSYSPYDNVRAHDDAGRPVAYPAMLVTAGLEDPRVGFWEPAKWVARLRTANPANQVLLRTELGAGHGGPSGRYESWREEAYVQAFLLDALGRSGLGRLEGHGERRLEVRGVLDR